MNSIIWIEGLNYRSGEKVESISDDGVEYTTLLTKAMRVKPKDRPEVKQRLIDLGIVESFITFIPTSYTPSGTLYKSKTNV